MNKKSEQNSRQIGQISAVRAGKEPVAPVLAGVRFARPESATPQTDTSWEACCSSSSPALRFAPAGTQPAGKVRLPSAPVKAPGCQDSCCEPADVKMNVGSADVCCPPSAETIPAGSGCCSSGQCQTSDAPGEDAAEQLNYRVGGMDCPSCAATIVRRVSQVPGVVNCEVSFSAGTMQVALSQPDLRSDVEKAVQKLGFTLDAVNREESDTYLIRGMDCGACAVTIEKHLLKTPGVNAAEVSFATGRMLVQHTLTQEQIISEVRKAGYEAQQLSAAATVPEPGRFSGLNSVLISGAALATGFVLSYMHVPDIVPVMFYALSVVVGGLKPFRSAWYATLSRSLDMNVLMSAAALGAAVIGQWLEGASVVFLFSLGTALQTRSIEKTRNSIRSLMALAPEQATIRRSGEWLSVPVAQIRPGDIMLVKPADRLALDGEVVTGESGVNQAPITGESIPVDKAPGDEVYAGSINHNGVLEVRVTRAASDTALARIIHMVEDAQNRKSPTQSFVERFSAIYTPVVFVGALLIMVLPPLLASGGWGEWFYRGLELLVVACPCALVISTPVAIVSAIGNAARHGILVKGGITLEKLGSIRALAFDKTGTLTEGRPRVTEWQVFSGEPAQLLNIALSIEEHSTHPLAAAVSAWAHEQGAKSLDAAAHKAIPGKGAVATLGGTVWQAGNEKLFTEVSFAAEMRAALEQVKNQGASLVLLGTQQSVHAVFAIADAIRPTTLDALNRLRADGMTHTLMLTGDNEGTARTIAAQAGVDSWRAELMPEDKVNVIEEWQQKGTRIAMVGDGINDAPALAAADIGIAMGGAGTDSAIETADVVLMSDRLEQLPHAFALSKLTAAIIHQNIIFSLAVKAVALALIFLGWLTLWIAVLSDTGAALLVILNSLRLLRFRR
ncbi:heavy metal translocating P-type ATPase [Enterobacter sp.]|uniref:heavy metal translocating P-type ATPase n=1 Tax=Enterobacter sp. TaxID=42895 RepID=UPI00296E94E2|nr:heavy metal translocating P-type ATPase [Enterobacter sp.]